MDAPKQRTSLTKKQLETGAGLELLNICQSITADGRIADEEIQALDHWLKQNHDSSLPAVRLLVATLSRVLEDGIITEAERISVAETIEAILPIEERKLAKGIRKQVERERAYDAKQAAKEKKALEQPVAHLDFMVAGTRHDDRDLIISHEIREACQVFLRRDPENRHSRFAVEVLTDRGNMIGFVPNEDAREIAHLLDAGAPHIAHVKKVLDYDSGDIPVVVAKVYRPGTQPAPSTSVHKPSPSKPSKKRRWPLALLVMIILFVVLAQITKN